MSLKTLNNLEGHVGKRVLGGEIHHKTARILNWGLRPQPPLLKCGASLPTPPFLWWPNLTNLTNLG